MLNPEELILNSDLEKISKMNKRNSKIFGAAFLLGLGFNRLLTTSPYLPKINYKRIPLRFGILFAPMFITIPFYSKSHRLVKDLNSKYRNRLLSFS